MEVINMNNLNIPKKNAGGITGEMHNFQARLDDVKAIKFGRVREVLGGYSVQEILEILVDKAIEAYDDGEIPHKDYLPKSIANKMDREDIQKLIGKVD